MCSLHTTCPLPLSCCPTVILSIPMAIWTVYYGVTISCLISYMQVSTPRPLVCSLQCDVTCGPSLARPHQESWLSHWRRVHHWDHSVLTPSMYKMYYHWKGTNALHFYIIGICTLLFKLLYIGHVESVHGQSVQSVNYETVYASLVKLQSQTKFCMFT